MSVLIFILVIDISTPSALSFSQTFIFINFMANMSRILMYITVYHYWSYYVSDCILIPFIFISSGYLPILTGYLHQCAAYLLLYVHSRYYALWLTEFPFYINIQTSV